MTETNKVILAAVLGILVGFGGGRLLENRGAGAGTQGDDVKIEETEVSAEGEMNESEDSGTSNKGDASTNKADTAASDMGTKIVVEMGDVSVAAGDQKAGMLVLASYTTDRTSWVVVHEDRDGKPGNVLGARRVPTGTGSIDIMLLRGTVAGLKYYVMLHSDNGDGMFDLAKDMPTMDGSNPVWATFMAK